MNWLTYALLSALFAGLVAVFGKVGVRDVDSTLATMVRSIVMALALVGLVLVKSADGSSSINLNNVRLITGRTWLFVVLAGLAGAASWLCYFRALQMGDAARVAPIDRLSVLVAIIFGVLFLGERLTTNAALGALLILGGSILIAYG
jgi:bacterial/archaeal transporter family protein